MLKFVDSSAPSHPWVRLVLSGMLLLLGFAAVAGFLYQNISEARDRRFNPMPGKLVQIGGSKMHIHCTGQGSPAVILDSGLGDSYVPWRKVQPEIAKFSQVCSYDRAGLGYSDPTSEPRTSKIIAEQLHALLQAAQIPPPYVLVGHSMGGYDVRLYASLYRSDVVGMVLVDASHPDQENRLPAQLKGMEGSWQREAEFIEYTMPIGIPRLLGLCDEHPLARAAGCNFQTAREGVAELKAFNTSAAQASAAGSLGDMPLAVLSHDPDKPSSEFPPDLDKSVNQAWDKMQDELANLSTRGTRAIAKNSGHYIQSDRPDMVIDAVRNVTEQARQLQSASTPAQH